MAFKKGQSGNPGGRPKELKDIKLLAQSHGAEALAVLVKVAKEGKSEAARVAAASALLDRGFGKPLQQIEVGKPGEFEDMTPSQLRSFIASESAELGLGNETVN